jgi:hypothetical protein
MSVAVIFCTDDTTKAKFTLCYGALIHTSIRAGIDLSLGNPQSSASEHGHTIAVESVLAQGDSHLLFLDSNMVFPHDTLTRLLAHDVDVVGATYSRRRPPFGLDHIELDGLPGGIARSESGVKEVAAVGTGCMLIATEVFKHGVSRYFDSQWVNAEDGSVQRLSEDFHFCRDVRHSGRRIWVDIDLSREVRQIGSYETTLEQGQALATR